jgi:tripartite-type tricarboxylate transporter receptor subunit TctC
MGVLALAFIAFIASPMATAAAVYPERPIRLIVPFPPGGGADTLARLVMSRVAERLGATIVIENRAGAGGNIGAVEAARAAPDGYTLLYGTNGTHVTNQAVYKSTGFDPVADFEPVGRVSEIGLVAVVNNQVPARSLQELVALLKADPRRITAATAGRGTTSHLAAELFKLATGADLTMVHYRGGAAAIVDVVSGQVQMMIEVMPNALPQVQAGTVRALAVTTGQRWPSAPTLPTVAEAGLPELRIAAWDGIFAPRGTDAAIIAKLSDALRQALQDPAMGAALIERGARAVPSSPAALSEHVAAERASWAPRFRRIGAIEQ